MILWSEGATKAQENEANSVLEVLTTAYPGYPWGVRVYDGGIFIRNLDFPANWGMNMKAKNVQHDAAVFKREIIMMAGEWLERANLRRGRNVNEDQIVKLEGAPDNHQPGWSKEKIRLEELAKSELAKIETNTSVDAALRDKVRPQAIKQALGQGQG